MIGTFAPWTVTPLLMLGGAYLCYEGLKKLTQKVVHPSDVEADRKKLMSALAAALMLASSFGSIATTPRQRPTAALPVNSMALPLERQPPEYLVQDARSNVEVDDDCPVSWVCLIMHKGRIFDLYQYQRCIKCLQ